MRSKTVFRYHLGDFYLGDCHFSVRNKSDAAEHPQIAVPENFRIVDGNCCRSS